MRTDTILGPLALVSVPLLTGPHAPRLRSFTGTAIKNSPSGCRHDYATGVRWRIVGCGGWTNATTDGPIFVWDALVLTRDSVSRAATGAASWVL